MTAPFLADTPTLLPFTLGQAVSVTAQPLPATPGGVMPAPILLELTSGRLSFDETQAPRVRLELSARVPEDQAVLDVLDPRAAVRLKVSAGYVRPDGVDVHPQADLVLRERRVSRPSNTLTLVALGEESVVLGGAPESDQAFSGDLAGAIDQVLTATVGAHALTSTLPPTTLLASTITPAQDWWAQMDDWLDRRDGGGADLYDDGLRRWRLIPRPVLGEPAHDLIVGVRGTITAADTALSVADWHNVVRLEYRWSTQSQVRTVGADGVERTETLTVDHLVIGKAAVTSGPYLPSRVGRRVYRETRNVATTQEDADSAAVTVLGRRLASGRTQRLRAITAWWLRPGHTVLVQLPTGPPVLALVVSVVFDLTAGEMDVVVRTPDTDTAITQGA